MQLYTSVCLLSAVLEFYLISIKKKKKTVITFKCLVPEDGMFMSTEFMLSILIYFY